MAKKPNDGDDVDLSALFAEDDQKPAADQTAGKPALNDTQEQPKFAAQLDPEMQVRKALSEFLKGAATLTNMYDKDADACIDKPVARGAFIRNLSKVPTDLPHTGKLRERMSKLPPIELKNKANIVMGVQSASPFDIMKARRDSLYEMLSRKEPVSKDRVGKLLDQIGAALEDAGRHMAKLLEEDTTLTADEHRQINFVMAKTQEFKTQFSRALTGLKSQLGLGGVSPSRSGGSSAEHPKLTDNK